MKIVINQTTTSPIALPWTRPIAVFDGTKKQAQEWCDAKNKSASNTPNSYSWESVKTIKA